MKKHSSFPTDSYWKIDNVHDRERHYSTGDVWALILVKSSLNPVRFGSKTSCAQDVYYMQEGGHVCMDSNTLPDGAWNQPAGNDDDQIVGLLEGGASHDRSAQHA